MATRNRCPSHPCSTGPNVRIIAVPTAATLAKSVDAKGKRVADESAVWRPSRREEFLFLSVRAQETDIMNPTGKVPGSATDSTDLPAVEGPRYPRRAVLKTLTAIGVGSAVFQRALAQQVAEKGEITAEMIRQAEWITGLELSDEQRDATAKALQQAEQGGRRCAKYRSTTPSRPHSTSRRQRSS